MIAFRGTVAFVSGDNLGSQEIGGFKIGSSSALKCRVCMGNANDVATKVILTFLIIQWQIDKLCYHQTTK